MVISVIKVVDKNAVEMRMLTWVYSTDIREDIILFYEWCQLRGVDISASKHGLLSLKSGQECCVNGVRVAGDNKPDTEIIIKIFIILITYFS